MSEMNFSNSVKEVQSFLKEIGLFKEQGVKVINRDDVSGEFKNASQKADYFNLYKVALRNFDYDILLKDDSIFQFSYKFNGSSPPDIRFAFFQNPRQYKSYDDFLEILTEKGLIEKEGNESISDLLEEEYQQFLTEQNINESSTSIRFDVDATAYKPLIHSTAHFHIGHKNNVRIPCKIILSPLKFSIFIIKHVYYTVWKTKIGEPTGILATSLSNSKSTCLKLHPLSWDQITEQKEMFFS
ncbi:hypothetical protein AQ505_10930 [Pedobacter sp. PACM 27299]|uniref:DUF2290 domain-containing protein n=1 Tax=Pedobacter sp. PACM 27299 TaxID=1727164 RepID=UPI000706EC7D|nr:DUF2290 domain-containing protein [Pedobacter sp. PACM 27299]ALL05961.1 hypothetical protein AQ505_10930 [Pedobacter sp. PACM 27299]